MSLFSRLFRKPDPQPLGTGPLHPEHNPFHSAVPTLRIERFAESASAATDPPAAGNGASPVDPIVDAAALDFDRQHCAEVALLISREAY